MDKLSIEAMKRKVEEFNIFIDECNDPEQLLRLNEARDMFIQTLKEWQEKRG